MDDFFDEISDDYLEQISYINCDGIALDDYGNEFRDEVGMIVIIPKDKWHLFEVIAWKHL